MRCSLIITTYNWREALLATLTSALHQQVLPDEIIIADDGSDARTRAWLDVIRPQLPIPLIHCWQEDAGFRAAAIRNQAIRESHGEYLILIDGDMLLPPYFVADHLRFAKTGQFIQGTRVLLSPQFSRQCLQHQLEDWPLTNPCRYRWSEALKFGNCKNLIRCPRLARYSSRVDNQLAKTRTCNFSLFRADAFAVNGFDEDFIGWGREDSELAARLFHVGKQRLYLRFAGQAWHLFHPENPRTQLAKNQAILDKTLRGKRQVCTNGLLKKES